MYTYINMYVSLRMNMCMYLYIRTYVHVYISASGSEVAMLAPEDAFTRKGGLVKLLLQV